MAWSPGYLTTFAVTPTMTLHNGTTHCARTIISQSNYAPIELIPLPGKTVYNPNGTGQASVLVTMSYSVDIELRGLPSFWGPEIAVWAGNIGKQGTLTLSKFGGGTSTCTAHLEGPIEDITEQPHYAFNFRVLRLTFVTTTRWT